MRNALEETRHVLGLSYAEVARRTGYTTATVWKHCNGILRIGEKAALRYHARLGIPLTDLCPDLFKEGAENAA